MKQRKIIGTQAFLPSKGSLLAISARLVPRYVPATGLLPGFAPGFRRIAQPGQSDASSNRPFANAALARILTIPS
jgi:hypothetical protein